MKVILTRKQIIISLILFSLIISFLCFIGCYLQDQVGEYQGKTEMKRYQSLPYFQDSRFINEEPIQHFKSKASISKKIYALTFATTPDPDTPFKIVPRTGDSFPILPDSFSITWGGHSTLIGDIDSTRFITDPIFDHASPIPGIARRLNPSPFNRKNLPPLDFILISHDHYDHLEVSTMRHFAKENQIIICPLGVGKRLLSWGIDSSRVIELGWNESAQIKNLKITAVTTRHFSGRFLIDKDRTLWNAYVIKGTHHNLFFGGDGGHGKHFKKIGETYGPFDMTCLEIGAYSPAWPNSHHFPEEAIQSHLDLQGRYFLPIHWGTYDLSFHSWEDPILRAIKTAQDKKVKIITPIQGETIYLPTP